MDEQNPYPTNINVIYNATNALVTVKRAVVAVFNGQNAWADAEKYAEQYEINKLNK